MRTTVKKRTVLLFATRKHSSRMPTVRSSPYGGGGHCSGGLCPMGLCPLRVCQGDPPPLEGTWDQAQRPLEGTCGQAARQDATSFRDPPTTRIRHTPVKILPCPKLRLRAVIKITIFK